MAQENLISRLIKGVTKTDISKDTGSIVFLTACLQALRHKSSTLYGYEQIRLQADLVESLVNAADLPVGELKEA
eukprot:6013012-Karenia_brevis.AAC.1